MTFVTSSRLSRRCAGGLAIALYAAPALAQYGTTTSPSDQPNNYPPALPARRTPGPVLVFERLGEVVLPGPLAAFPGFVDDGMVVIPVEGGFVRLPAELDATPSIDPVTVATEDSEWVATTNGKRRFRTTQEGVVEAEKRRGEGKKWKRSWRLVAPNSIFAKPVLAGPRLCYAGLDDRVTCVRAKNGHRLWAVDLGDRLTRGVTCWPRCGDQPGDGEILLAVPDDGATVIALDAYDGRKVASFELPATHHFASPALVVSKDRIALSRKGYDDREAALVLLRLVPPPPPEKPAAVPYNDVSPAPSSSSGGEP